MQLLSGLRPLTPSSSQVLGTRGAVYGGALAGHPDFRLVTAKKVFGLNPDRNNIRRSYTMSGKPRDYVQPPYVYENLFSLRVNGISVETVLQRTNYSSPTHVREAMNHPAKCGRKTYNRFAEAFGWEKW